MPTRNPACVCCTDVHVNISRVSGAWLLSRLMREQQLASRTSLRSSGPLPERLLELWVAPFLLHGAICEIAVLHFDKAALSWQCVDNSFVSIHVMLELRVCTPCMLPVAATLEPHRFDVRHLLVALLVVLVEHFARRLDQAEVHLAIGLSEFDNVQTVRLHHLNAPTKAQLPVFKTELRAVLGLLRL